MKYIILLLLIISSKVYSQQLCVTSLDQDTVTCTFITDIDNKIERMSLIFTRGRDIDEPYKYWYTITTSSETNTIYMYVYNTEVETTYVNDFCNYMVDNVDPAKQHYVCFTNPPTLWSFAFYFTNMVINNPRLTHKQPKKRYSDWSKKT